MRDQLQSRFHPFTDTQKWMVYAALWPVCLFFSLVTLYLGWGRVPDGSDIWVGYMMMFFALPYSFFHTLTFGSWFDGESHFSHLALFWLPFVVAHLTFFVTRNGWALWFITLVWLIASFRWHFYGLYSVRM